MAVQVAVIDPLPLFRDGVMAALAATGYEVLAPPDVVAWVRQVRDAIVIVTVQTEADWIVLASLSELESTVHSVIALLSEDSPAAGVRAVRAGARSVLSRRISAEKLQRVLVATVDGQAVLPPEVVALLASGGGVMADSQTLTAEQLAWLRLLAAGSTVAGLASQVGYSERAMFRLLRSLYREMGVGGKVEALMRAQQQGWLQASGGSATGS